MAARPTLFRADLQTVNPTYLIPATGKDAQELVYQLYHVCWQRMELRLSRPTNTGRDWCKRKRPILPRA